MMNLHGRFPADAGRSAGRSARRMKEQILLFHFEDPERLRAVRRALAPLHVSCTVVPEEDWRRPVGALVGLEAAPREELAAAALTDEVMLLCGLTGPGIQLAVGALRRAGLYIPYKAALTPTNKDWTVEQLFFELYQEHQYMQQHRAPKHAEAPAAEEAPEGTGAETDTAEKDD